MRCWIKFNKDLKEKSEDELMRDLTNEMIFKRRFSYASRIHTRMNALRVIRERAEIERKCKEDA